jgi:hypothetical protein
MEQQIAQGLASLGRGKDTMLMHVTPNEVAGLQQLAMAKGGSLTINPQTGLPEAGFFDDVIGIAAPIAAGYFLGPAGLGMGSLGAGLTVGAGMWALTGDPMKGITAGLGAYGGSGLGSAMGKYGAVTEVAKPGMMASSVPGTTGVSAFTGGASAAAPQVAAGTVPTLGNAVNQFAPAVGSPVGMANSFNMASNAPLPTLSSVANVADDVVATGAGAGAGQYSQNLVPNAGQGFKNFFGMGEAGKGPIDFFKNGPGGVGEALTMGAPVLTGINSLNKPKPLTPLDPGYQMNYDGPYTPTERDVRYPTADEQASLGSAEYQYFNPVQPFPGFESASSRTASAVPTKTFAGGGPISFDEGGKVASVGEVLHVLDQATKNNYAVKPATNNSDVQEALATMGGKGKGGAAQAIVANSMGELPPVVAKSMGGKGKGGGREGFAGLFDLIQNGDIVPSSNLTPTDYARLAERTYNPQASIDASQSADGAELSQFSNPIQKKAGGGLLDFTQGGIAEPPTQEDSAVGYAMGGGIHSLRSGGRPSSGGYLDGMGDGMSDSIPATIEGKQPARLADGEFVIPADVVSHLGNGSTKAGASHLYGMLNKVRKARTGRAKQGKQINPNKFMPA